MIEYFLGQLQLSPQDVQTVNLNSEFKINEKKFIYFTIPINQVTNFQEKLAFLHANLSQDQFVVFRFETIQGRIRRIQNKQWRIVSILIVSSEFLLHRVIPRVLLFKFIYKKLTKSRIRVISKAEALGRIVYAGFKIHAVENSEKHTYAIFKPSNADFRNQKPSFGPLYSMPRIGKNGKIIKVYKIRTMHPYSEFLHDFMISKHGYGALGKPKNDFRVTNWGKFLRKFWIDEIPQIFNVLKGDMKLVGLRPVSQVYFNGLSEELQKMRIKFKPGCIPPYVAFNEKSSRDSVLLAEEKYIALKNKNPYTTDIGLFFKALYFILIKKQRGS